MEFERVTVGESESQVSILKNVSIRYALDHYRNLVMSRYPSELDDLVKSVIPNSKRHAQKDSDFANGAMLFYHYIMHGFRSNGLKIMNVVETDHERIPTHRVWMTYLQLPMEDVDVCSYGELTSRMKPCAFDAIIFNHYDPARSAEEHIENIYQYIIFALLGVKPFGFVAIEGIPPSSIHYLHSVIGYLYLYPEMCEVNTIVPLSSSGESTYTVFVRRMFDSAIPEHCAPLLRPMIPIVVPEVGSVLVLITSAMKSKGNSNIVPERTRWRQLLHSIRTVRQKIPNAYVVVSELTPLSQEMMQELTANGVNEVRVFASLEGVSKSYCESIVMKQIYSDILLRPDNDFICAIKLSGRYFLMPEYEFKTPNEVVCKRMRPQEVMTRYIQIPRRLFGKYVDVLNTVVQMPEVQKAEMDIEHALGHNFPEMDEAGKNIKVLNVGGFYATNGQLLVE